MLYGLFRRMGWVLFKIYFRLRWEGREHVPRTGGALIACNHQSYLDPILIGVAMQRQRPVHFMARDTLFVKRWFAWLLRHLNAFPVRREGVDAAAIKVAVELMRSGRLVLVFPEGTRTHDGSLGPIHEGMMMMASRAGVPIVPAVVGGAFEAWPRHARLPRPRRIRVAFGEPIDPPGPTRSDRQDAVRVLVDRMRDLQARLKRLNH